MFKYFHEKYYSSRKDLYWHQIKIYMKGKYYIEIRHFVQIIQKFFFKIMFKYFCKISKKKIYIVYKLNKICMKSSNLFFHFIRLKIISGLKFAYWKKQHENVLYIGQAIPTVIIFKKISKYFCAKYCMYKKRFVSCIKLNKIYIKSSNLLLYSLEIVIFELKFAYEWGKHHPI